jgi:hypothetical protein
MGAERQEGYAMKYMLLMNHGSGPGATADERVGARGIRASGAHMGAIH